MKSFTDWFTEKDPTSLDEVKKWLQKAVDPEHEGACTPMTKKTCTPRRKALAKRFKSGDIHKANVKKSKSKSTKTKSKKKKS